jgi:hypothetical protein
MVTFNLEQHNDKYFWTVRINGLVAGMFTSRVQAEDYIRILSQFGMYQASA